MPFEEAGEMSTPAVGCVRETRCLLLSIGSLDGAGMEGRIPALAEEPGSVSLPPAPQPPAPLGLAWRIRELLLSGALRWRL